MRRVLIVFAVMAVVFVAVAFPQKDGISLPAASGSTQLTVVAQGLSARALAIGQQQSGPQQSVYVTVASPADRVFSLSPSSAPSASIGASQGPAAALIPVAGTGAAGSLGDGGAALSAQLSLGAALSYERSGIAVAADGTTYIADTENATIRRIAGAESTEPGIIRSVAGKWAPRQNVTLSRPMGIALDRAGNLYIADHTAGALDILRADTGILETVAQISSAASVAVTPEGTAAFVASPETGMVFAVDLHTRSIHSVAAIGSQAANADPSQVSPCAQGSTRVCPAGLAVDSAGNLFVSDLTFGKVLRVDSHTGATTVALSGLQQPGAIAFDAQGRNLYIVEQGLNRLIVAQGLGDPPSALSLAPSSWPFANEPISGVSQQEQFTVTNTSTTAVASNITFAFQPTSPATQKDFSVESASCLSTLSPGGTCSASVAFTPTSLGPLTSILSVTDTNGDTASSSLTGTGDDYQIQLASGQTQEMSVIEGSATTFHLQVVPAGVFGQSGEQVSINCPSDTPLRSTCTVTPATLTITPGSPSSFSVTIQTSSSATVLARLLPSLFFRPPNSLDRLLLIATVFCLLGLIALRSARSRLRCLRLPVLVISVVLLTGCHHPSSTALATPTGLSDILVQGSAVTKTGTPLNATRAITLTLDVLKN